VAKSATKLLPRGTTIVAITGTTMGQVSRIEIEACTNQSLVGILGSSELPDEFVYYWVRSLVSQLVRRQTGAAQQHVNKGDIKSLPLLVPDSASVADYMRVAEPAMRFISEQLFTARRLAELRDILLPKLISGQLRVPESYNPDGLHGEAEAGEREGVGLSL
jgi:type I restriction enzyme S subunit